MLNPALRRRITPNIIPAAVTEEQRIVALVLAARERLRSFAELDEHVLVYNPTPVGFLLYPKASLVMLKLGFFDGIGIVLKLASFDVRPDGSFTSPQELARFRAECQLLIDGLTGSALNYTMMLMLSLVIYVELVIYHAGGKHALFGPEAWTAAKEHTAECIVLASGMMFSVVGWMEAVFLYATYTSGLPSVASKCQRLVEASEKMSILFCSSMCAVSFVLFALPFLAARASEAMFVATLVVFGFTWIETLYVTSPYGPVAKLLQAQNREAKAILGVAGKLAAAALPAEEAASLSSPPPSPPLPPPAPTLKVPGTSPSSPFSLSTELAQLATLHYAGSLTDEEFSAAKSAVIQRG